MGTVGEQRAIDALGEEREAIVRFAVFAGLRRRIAGSPPPVWS
jgi:hypothetical protein